MENETQIAEKQSFLQQHLMSIPELEVGQIVTGTVVQTNDEIQQYVSRWRSGLARS